MAGACEHGRPRRRRHDGGPGRRRAGDRRQGALRAARRGPSSSATRRSSSGGAAARPAARRQRDRTSAATRGSSGDASRSSPRPSCPTTCRSASSTRAPAMPPTGTSSAPSSWPSPARSHAIATAPLNKEAMHLAGHGYPGHTELLAELCGRPGLRDDARHRADLRVIHVSTHVVAARGDRPRSTPERVLHVIRLGRRRAARGSASTSRGSRSCGPQPARRRGRPVRRARRASRSPRPSRPARAAGIDAERPARRPTPSFCRRRPAATSTRSWPCTTTRATSRSSCSASTPGVNVTLGLPIIRTSVDHGTAFDIAWQGIAFTDSLRAALDYAWKLAGRPGVTTSLPPRAGAPSTSAPARRRRRRYRRATRASCGVGLEGPAARWRSRSGAAASPSSRRSSGGSSTGSGRGRVAVPRPGDGQPRRRHRRGPGGDPRSARRHGGELVGAPIRSSMEVVASSGRTDRGMPVYLDAQRRGARTA